MIRWLIGALALCALAVALTFVLQLNAGYVLVVVPGYRVELSLNMAIFLVLLLTAVFYWLLRAAVLLKGLPKQIAAQREARQHAQALATFFTALREYFAGRYALTETTITRARALGAPADLSALIAARAAHELRAPERRDAYLAESVIADAPDAARLITEAQLRLEERRAADAVALLAQLPQKHTAGLRLELRARQQLGDWHLVPALIDALEKRHVFAADRAAAERRHAWRQWLERDSHEADRLNKIWKQIPSAYRTESLIAGVAAIAYQGFGQIVQARAIIEQSLAQHWDDGLVHLYGECGAVDDLGPIERAERWLQSHQQNATLLYTLGRLCEQQQLWGKAQNYFEASIGVKPTHAAHFALAQLHEKLARPDEAQTAYRASLQLAHLHLQRLGGGHRHPPL